MTSIGALMRTSTTALRCLGLGRMALGAAMTRLPAVALERQVRTASVYLESAYIVRGTRMRVLRPNVGPCPPGRVGPPSDGGALEPGLGELCRRSRFPDLSNPKSHQEALGRDLCHGARVR